MLLILANNSNTTRSQKELLVFKKTTMKKIVKYILLLNTFFGISQIKNGIIEYGVIAHMPITADNEVIAEQIKKMSINDTLVSYKLNFIPNESYFYIEPVILHGYENEEEFSSHVMIQPKHYISLKDSVYKFYENNKFIGKYAIELEKEAKWTLTKETKKIGNYLCYKAISPFYNYSRWHEDNPQLNVIAWFTPQIPVSFGPNGYHGLPGLILELQTHITTIYVKKIDLNIENQPELNNLSKFKLITLGQKRQAMSRLLSSEQARFIEEEETKRKEKESLKNKNEFKNKPPQLKH